MHEFIADNSPASRWNDLVDDVVPKRVCALNTTTTAWCRFILRIPGHKGRVGAFLPSSWPLLDGKRLGFQRGGQVRVAFSSGLKSQQRSLAAAISPLVGLGLSSVYMDHVNIACSIVCSRKAFAGLVEWVSSCVGFSRRVGRSVLCHGRGV
jgi:hypothetical protein